MVTNQSAADRTRVQDPVGLGSSSVQCAFPLPMIEGVKHDPLPLGLRVYAGLGKPDRSAGPGLTAFGTSKRKVKLLLRRAIQQQFLCDLTHPVTTFPCDRIPEGNLPGSFLPERPWENHDPKTPLGVIFPKIPLGSRQNAQSEQSQIVHFRFPNILLFNLPQQESADPVL